jgi:hypothetical protein
MDNLSKEQLLLLQDHLSYSVYEEFMGMFPKYEVLPNDSESFCEKIVSMMKEHDYWGEITGWGENRKYIRISEHNHVIENAFELFKGKPSEKFIEWMDKFKQVDYLNILIEYDMLSVED